MSSKGKDYEIAAYDYFAKLINDNYFGFDAERCTLSRQKSYFSKDRESNIFFDLVLEYFLPNQTSPSIIFIIECKNYSSKVSIDDLEEFTNKIDQIRTLKAIPIFLTTIGFQESCLKYARNRGIALWLYKPSLNHEILLNRQKLRLQNLNHQIYKALIDSNFDTSHIGNIFIQTPFKLTLYPKDFLLEYLKKDKILNELKILNKNYKTCIPYLSKKEIAKRSFQIYEKFNLNLEPIDLFEIIKKLNIKLIVSNELKNEDLIAQINFKRREIFLYGIESFTKEQLYFALAHEIGHFYLEHDKYLIEESKTENTSKNIIFSQSNTNIDRLEFQANYFAATLLIPEKILISLFFSLLKKYEIVHRGIAPLYIDNQICNLENYRKVCLPLCNFFNVSQETLKIRLEELKLAKFNV